MTINELFKTEKVKVSDLVPHVKNPRKIKQEEKKKLWERLKKFGMIGIPIRDADGSLLSGHQRCEVMVNHGLGDYEIDVRTAVRKLTEPELHEVMMIENTHAGDFDLKKLQEDFSEYIDVQDFGISLEDLIEQVGADEKQVEAEPEYSIVPKYSEKYSAVIIVIENSIDENFVRSVLKLEAEKDYKTDNIGESYVLTAQRFIELWQKK